MILGMPNTFSTVLPKNECAQIGQAAVDSLCSQSFWVV